MNKNEQTERKLFKDWFDLNAAESLRLQVDRVYPEFDGDTFVRLASKNLDGLEFKARILQFSSALRETLPQEPSEALRILTESLPGSLPDCEATTDGWLQWPVGEYIALHGLEHFEASMNAMIELTQRFSSEFAVRPFIAKNQNQALDRLLALTKHQSPHVRRWTSEGSRPRLPWGAVLKELVADPAPLWPILDSLKDDPELYVRRSVANSINDISKDHPDLVVQRMKAWSQGASDERRWLIKHALRTLIKAANPQALEILGFTRPKHIVADFSLQPERIQLGETVELRAKLSNTGKKSIPLQVDFVVHYVRKAGKVSEKVFKWKTLELAAGGEMVLVKRHAMKKTTIRALYSGTHKIEIQINGKRMGNDTFDFKTS